MKKYIIPGAVIIFCSILIYQTYSMKTIKEELANINTMNVSLQEKVDSLSSELGSEMQATLYEELGKSYLTKNVNFKLNKNTDEGYDLTTTVELSEIKEGSKVLFMYKPTNSKDWNSLELKKKEELSYVGDFNLTYDNDYEYKIIVKGDKTESSDIEDLSKYLFMPELPDVSWSYNDNGIYFSAHLYVDEDGYKSSAENNIKSVEVIVNNNETKTYKCAYNKENIYDENNKIVDESKYYEVNIPKEVYKDKVNSIKIKVTYESGIINIEDVTNRQSE